MQVPAPANAEQENGRKKEKRAEKNDWIDLPDGEAALWRHHELFQGAVNYYTLCLAAMVEGMDEESFANIALEIARKKAASDPKHKTETARIKAVTDAAETAKAMITAIKGWRDAVRTTWIQGERRGKKIAGGCWTVTPILKAPVAATDDSGVAFAKCAAAALKDSRASKQQRAAALLQLLEEAADNSDLSVLVNDRLGWFCSPKGMNDKTPKSMSSSQEAKRQRQACEFRDLPDEEAIARASTLDLGLFLTTPPKEEIIGKDAERTLREYWAKALKAHPGMANATKLLDAIAPEVKKGSKQSAQQAAESGEPLRIPAPGRKPSGLYPVAAVFRFIPCVETLAAFRTATAPLCKAKEKQIVEDAIADARVDDTPHFAYFTNLAFHRDGDAKQQAAWKEFDSAALVEAVKSPHRYYQDTQKRLAAATELEQELKMMESEGRAGGSDEGEGGKHGLDGFADDHRIERLVAVLYSDLGHLGEVDSPDDNGLERQFITATIARLEIKLPEHSREYTLRERTLRSWRAVRDAWRDLAQTKEDKGKGEPNQEELWAVVAKEQGEHKKDFGSARFYEALTEPANLCIWKDKGCHDFHADDPVSAWAEYTELRRELRDKRRAIRFTPAHPTESPRFFIFPKKASAGGKWGSSHELTAEGDAMSAEAAGTLAFTAGIAVKDGEKWRPVMTRIIYRAPRLRRDEMRRDGETSLKSAPWLQPMVKALGLTEPPAQDFGNCRITLQPRPFEDKDGKVRYSVQLTFPVEVQAEALIAQIGKQSLWAKRFNLTPDGDNFRESTLRRKHEKQPKDPPRPLEELIQRFTFGSIDFGLHADSWAMHEARLDGNFGVNKKGKPIVSRAITTGEEAPWRLATRELRKLRLPGSDAKVWRARSKKDDDDSAGFDWREELSGDRGRSASSKETVECTELMCKLLGEPWAWEFVSHQTITAKCPMPDDWKRQMDLLLQEFSFPEQNDKLIVVARRAQSRLARIARWRSGMAEDSRWEAVLKELRQTCGFEDKDGRPLEPKLDGAPLGEQWIPSAIREAASVKGRAALKAETRKEQSRLIETLPPLLVRIANRVLPLRGRSWKWETVEDREKEGRLHGLEQTGPKITDVLLAGQRGLSIMRIEQIEELRRRIQSFNQAERRHYAAEQVEEGAWQADFAKQWVRRDFTDPCADVLEKLDEMKTQRVNQSAHMILAQVLGVRLAKPPANKKALRQERDQHGVYEKFREPVDFVAIEDLSRYRASQGRAPQENGRLMKWCHRAVRDKLRELCEPFGIPVLEVPAAYSSQFCSRSGVIGFRAEEVTEGFEKRAPWLFRLRVKDGEEETQEQREMRKLAADLYDAQRIMEKIWREKHKTGQPPKVTVIMPKQGGQIFVPVVAAEAQGNRFAAKVADADLNAAVNIGLRAVADPRMWEFFPRLRTTRVSGEVSHKGRKRKQPKSKPEGDEGAPVEKEISLCAREKRKYGETGPNLSLGELPSGSAARETKQPNYFVDYANIAKWDKAWVDGPAKSGRVELVSAKSLFKALRDVQWQRCQEINATRIKAWES